MGIKHPYKITCKNPQTKTNWDGNSLVVQWLGLGALTAKGASSVPGQGTKISQAEQLSQKK